MDIGTTRVFEDLAQAWLSGKYRRALLEGGTYASKTWSVLQLLFLIAKGAKAKLLISVVSESLPHLRKGCIKDFFDIIGESQDNNPQFNKTTFTYKVSPLASIEFFGADEADKTRGPRRDILFINEGNNISWETAWGLDMRTEKFTIVDWNPVSEFWAHENWVNRPGNAYIHSTYKDALSYLSKGKVEDIEAIRDLDANLWRIYGEGLLGKLEHLIWPNYEVVADLPPKERWEKWAYGLDFGFTHPAALVKIVFAGEMLYWDERIYQRKLTNADLIEKLTHEERADIYADSSRPEAIEEIARAGWNIYPANKDVKTGLDVVKRQKVHITQSSVGLLKEIRNYSYMKDKDGHILEVPVKIADDLVDSGRYGTLGLTERFGYATAAGGGRAQSKRGNTF